MDKSNSENYDSVVAVHGFDPLSPQDPDTKDFDTVAQDRIREAYHEVQRQEENGEVLFVLTGGSYKERLDDHLTENGHNSVEEYDLPSEAELMNNQLDWMYKDTEDGEGRLDADETGWENEHGSYIGDIDDIDAEIVLEGESQNTGENIDYLLDITDSSEASELYAVTSRDHAPRAGYGNVQKIEDDLNDVKVRPVSSKLSYAAPERDKDGNITELNPGVLFGEKGNKLRPIINELDEIWRLFGSSRDEIQEKSEDIRKALER